MKQLLLFFFVFTLAFPITAQDDAKSTTFYFIRHAEKDRSDPNNKNPHLTEEGKARAERWSQVLQNISFDRVYSTEYNRTMQTARPTASRHGIDVISIYDPRNLDGKAFIEINKGLTVLVVGHSNSTPLFVNAILGSNKYAQIDDNNNGNLYIVTVSAKGEVASQLLYIN